MIYYIRERSVEGYDIGINTINIKCVLYNDTLLHHFSKLSNIFDWGFKSFESDISHESFLNSPLICRELILEKWKKRNIYTD